MISKRIALRIYDAVFVVAIIGFFIMSFKFILSLIVHGYL
jgi:hypothetical protein